MSRSSAGDVAWQIATASASAAWVGVAWGSKSEGVEDWLGVPMFFSSSDPDADRELFRDAGLAIRLDETVVQHAPEGDLPFHWTLAQKSNA